MNALRHQTSTRDERFSDVEVVRGRKALKVDEVLQAVRASYFPRQIPKKAAENDDVEGVVAPQSMQQKM